MTKRFVVYGGTFLALTATVPWFFFQPDEASWWGLPTWAAYTIGATVLYAAIIAWCLGRYWESSARACTTEDLPRERSGRRR